MDGVDAIMYFIAECGMMAEENWCQAQTEMLHRLFTAVLLGEKYDSEAVDKHIEKRKKEIEDEEI